MEYRNSEAWLVPIGVTDKGIKKKIRNAIGKIMLYLNPDLKNRFFNGYHPKNKLERSALASLVIRLNKSGNKQELAKLHRKMWESNDAVEFYKTSDWRFDNMFLNIKKDIDLIFDQIEIEGNTKNIVEIGCGNGNILEYLSKSRKGLYRYIGLDINEFQIKVNQEAYKDDSRFEFFACDANHWIQENPLPNTVYFTFGGVLEYFTEEEVKSLLKKISELPATGFVIYEPLAKEFDPKGNNRSLNFGSELSFSHAYYYLAKEVGLNIIFEQTKESENGRWILLGAINR